MLWQLMSRQCFTRSMAATWLIPLLDLLVRLKLHVVGEWRVRWWQGGWWASGGPLLQGRVVPECAWLRHTLTGT
jgi:hypothetical protein